MAQDQTTYIIYADNKCGKVSMYRTDHIANALYMQQIIEYCDGIASWIEVGGGE